MTRERTGGKAETEMNQTVGERIIKRAVKEREEEDISFVRMFLCQREDFAAPATGLQPLQAVT